MVPAGAAALASMAGPPTSTNDDSSTAHDPFVSAANPAAPSVSGGYQNRYRSEAVWFTNRVSATVQSPLVS